MYKSNNHKITEMKEKKIDLKVLKWWLNFGKYVWQMRYTEYHAGKAVIKDKNKLSEAMEKLARYEVAEEKDRLGQWIPCSERLPENAMNVIAQFSSGTVTELRYAGNGIFEGIYDYSTKVIIAWMPLPEPYKEKTE